jgi:hypothetical protein
MVSVVCFVSADGRVYPKFYFLLAFSISTVGPLSFDILSFDNLFDAFVVNRLTVTRALVVLRFRLLSFLSAARYAFDSTFSFLMCTML